MIGEVSNSDLDSHDVIRNEIVLWNGREIRVYSAEDTVTVSITWEFHASFIRLFSKLKI